MRNRLMLAALLFIAPVHAATVDQCKVAIRDFTGSIQDRNVRLERACASLPKADQDRAASIASKEDGMWVFIPPYQVPKDSAPSIDYHDFKQVQAAALKGDYQAIRNLGFGYSQWPMKGQKKDTVQACAWYLALQFTGSPKLNTSDFGNAWISCKQLSPGEYDKAAPMALEILKKLPRSW